jgi:hypothetical protein
VQPASRTRSSTNSARDDCGNKDISVRRPRKCESQRRRPSPATIDGRGLRVLMSTWSWRSAGAETHEMASEAPRSVGQGRTGQATKEGGRSKQPGHKTRQEQHCPQKSNNAQRRKPDSSRRTNVAGRMDCGREWRTGCLGREQQEGNWLRREGRASPGAAQHGQVVGRRAS